MLQTKKTKEHAHSSFLQGSHFSYLLPLLFWGQDSKSSRAILINQHKEATRAAWQFQPPICLSVSTETVSDPRPAHFHEDRGYLFFPRLAWVNTDQRSPPVSRCFTGQCVQRRWHQFGGYSEPTCRHVSKWLLWSGPSGPAIVEEIELEATVILSLLLATLWRLLIFQAPLSSAILSPHICAGAFSFCLYLHIKAHFLFSSKNRMVIFLKTQTHAFLNLRSFEDLVCSPDAIFQFRSSLSSSFSCEQTTLPHCSTDPVILPFSTFVMACEVFVLLGGMCSCVLSIYWPPLRLLWPVSKDNGEGLRSRSTGLLDMSQPQWL